MKRKILFSAMTLVILNIANIDVINAAANSNRCSYDTNWDLVDSGKHLDYEAFTQYYKIVDKAAATWNAYKSGVIRPDTLSNIEDVKIVDVNVSEVYAGQADPLGVIRLNTRYIYKYSNVVIQNIITHEIGHALGLAHSKPYNIMYDTANARTSLGSIDKSTYNCVYKYEY